jgi:recombinational DNA repair protein RecR
MDERERRIAENEILYRSVNERIEDLNAAFGAMTESMSVVCECGEGACAEQIEIGAADYERVRADPTHFIVLPGHEIADVEEVVAHGGAYHVVRKRPGGPAELAREHDHRP